jgi:FkbH-like protein
MFQIEWAQKGSWEKEPNTFPAHDSKLDRTNVRRAYWLHWEDHCLECAPPLCYTSCPLYFARADKACARFIYGIYPNPNFKGLFDFGADIRFRRWGKIETIVHGKIASVRFQRLMDRINRLVAYPSDGVPASHQPTMSARSANRDVKVFWKANFAKVRNKCFSWFATARENIDVDEFVLECFSPDHEAFRLVLEYSVGSMSPDHTFVGAVKLRHSFNIEPGWNFDTLPAQGFGFGAGNRAGKITLYPENNAERRLIFTWLDLVQYRERRPASTRDQQRLTAPAAKVKCVAWDLDNTLWKGILAEDGASNLLPRPDALDLIKKLDEKGIIQTVVSKNNYADAWAVIERLGLREYFLYPAINWQQKSVNLKAVAEKLNINLDTFALIDDSAFERAEVQSALPQVRVYSDEQIGRLLAHQEFDVPITDASGKRRVSYQTELTRQRELESFGGDYQAFLRSCEMKLRLFIPREEKHILRSFELIQRANQLNLSGKRYADTEFRHLLARPGVLCVAMDCRDRFGDYGIVGFASVDETQQEPVLKDFVLSCRVAQKWVEHTFLQWLAARETERGQQVLCAELVRTDRNQPLLKVFDDLRFVGQAQRNGTDILQLPLDPKISMGNIVTLVVEQDLQSALNETISTQ